MPDLTPYSLTCSIPMGVTPADLGAESWVRQCRAYGWATSRVGFARLLIATKVRFGSESVVSGEIRDYGGTLLVTSHLASRIPQPDGLRDRVYLGALDSNTHATTSILLPYNRVVIVE